MHANYINGHLFFGALLALFVGSAWLLATKAKVPPKLLVMLQLITIPVLVVTRPEASMILILCLVPILTSSAIIQRYKTMLLSVLGASVILWQGLLVYMLHQRSLGIPLSAWGLLIMGFGIVAVIPIIRFKIYKKVARFLPHLAEFGLWAALAFLATRNPSVLIDSINATIANVALGAGMWGWQLITLALLVIIVLILRVAPHRQILRYPITTFVPITLLLAYLREGAYRVGGGDSLNRMLMQIVPLAVLYVIIAIVAGRWRFAKERKKAK